MQYAVVQERFQPGLFLPSPLAFTMLVHEGDRQQLHGMHYGSRSVANTDSNEKTLFAYRTPHIVYTLFSTGSVWYSCSKCFIHPFIFQGTHEERWILSL